MIVYHRNPEVKYPRAMKVEKTQLVLDWLLEFRFSSYEILAERLGITVNGGRRFFDSLVDDGLIHEFKNVHTMHQQFVMLGAAGVAWLEAWGRDVSKAATRVQSLGRSAQIVHDLSVQRAVLGLLDKYVEVIWDRNIIFEDEDEYDRPDALLRSPKGHWVALEFERWRKEKARIYSGFIASAKAIKSQRYAGVIYIFSQQADQAKYQSLFNEAVWPIYRKEKTGRFKPIDQSFDPDSIGGLRQCFRFEVAAIASGNPSHMAGLNSPSHVLTPAQA